MTAPRGAVAIVEIQLVWGIKLSAAMLRWIVHGNVITVYIDGAHHAEIKITDGAAALDAPPGQYVAGMAVPCKIPVHGGQEIDLNIEQREPAPEDAPAFELTIDTIIEGAAAIDEYKAPPLSKYSKN